MGVTLGKRLFVLLAVVALVGAPWAQALAQGSAQGCPMTAAAAAVVAVDQTVPCNMAAHQADDGKTMTAACAQDCLAQLNSVVPAVGVYFADLAPAFEPAFRATMAGQTPIPELSPPIAYS